MVRIVAQFRDCVHNRDDPGHLPAPKALVHIQKYKLHVKLAHASEERPSNPSPSPTAQSTTRPTIVILIFRAVMVDQAGLPLGHAGRSMAGGFKPSKLNRMQNAAS